MRNKCGGRGLGAGKHARRVLAFAEYPRECNGLLLGVELQSCTSHVLHGVSSGGPAHQGVLPPN